MPALVALSLTMPYTVRNALFGKNLKDLWWVLTSLYPISMALLLYLSLQLMEWATGFTKSGLEPNMVNRNTSHSSSHGGSTRITPSLTQCSHREITLRSNESYRPNTIYPPVK